MPRKLPWAVDGDESKKSVKSNSTSTTPRKRRRHRTPDQDEGPSEDDLDLPPGSPARNKARNLSSSPLPAPPQEEYMIAGYDEDDGWRMVEDEFFSTARLFTAHLHQAEYKRRRKLAEQRQHREIERPTDGKTEQSNLSKLSRRARDQRQKTSEALEKTFGSAQDADEIDLEQDPFGRDSKLAALMGNNEYPKRLGKSIVRRPASQPSRSRLVRDQSFANPLSIKKGKAPANSSDEYDCDASLATPSGRLPLPAIKPCPTIPEPSSVWIGIGKTAKVEDCSKGPTVPTKRSNTLSHSAQEPEYSVSVVPMEDDFRKPSNKKRITPKVAARLAKLQKENRKMQSLTREVKTEETTSSSTRSDIPTFSF